jgi:hypothetical protein
MSAQLAHVVDLQEFRQRRHEHAAQADVGPAVRGRPAAIWMATCWVWVVIPWPVA